MPSAAERRAPRVDASLDVFLQTVDGDVPCETRDVSYEGVFIVGPDPLPLRKLIRFRTRLPDSDEQLQMLGLVAHTVNRAEAAEKGRDPGMGIQLFSLGNATRRRWRDFVDDLYERDPRARQSIESSKRPEIELRISDESMLRRLRTDDIPAGELFVRTPELHDEGTDLDCLLHHPTEDETYSLRAAVTKVVDESVKQRGVHLAFEIPDNPQGLEQFLGGPLGADDPPDAPAQNGPPSTPPSTPTQENTQ